MWYCTYIENLGMGKLVANHTVKVIGDKHWTLFLTRSRLLFYFLFRTRSICFRTTYRLQMALGVLVFLNFSYFNVLSRRYRVNNKVIDVLYILTY